MSRKLEPNYITPSLESITVRAKYAIPETDFNVVEKKLLVIGYPGWKYKRIGESLVLVYWGQVNDENWIKNIKRSRSGAPVYFSIIPVQYNNKSILVEVECRPSMWYRICQIQEISFMENEVQEALLDCRTFIKQVMSVFKGKEVEPISVYPIIQRTEIKSRFLNLGLKRIVKLLDKAEKLIIQNNFTDSLKSSRTAFEKMIDWQMKKRGLKKTNNYKNDLERLRSKGYLDSETTKLLQSCYRCLSNIGVHEKGEVEPGIYEAQMGYGIILIILQYFANKLP